MDIAERYNQYYIGLDEAILATFDADSELIEEDISGTFDDYEIPEEFTILSGM